MATKNKTKKEDDLKIEILTKEPIYFIRLVTGVEIVAPIKEKKGVLQLFQPMEIFQVPAMNGMPIYHLNKYVTRDMVDLDWLTINTDFIIIKEPASKMLNDFYWKMIAVYKKISKNIKAQVKKAMKAEKKGKVPKSTSNIPLLPKDQRFIDLSDPKYKDISDKVTKDIEDEKEEILEENPGRKNILKN